MALSGMHIVCSGATGALSNGPLPINPAWSQTMASAGTTASKAPNGGVSLIRCRATQDSFVAIGPTPDATNGARFFVAANADYDFYANPGDYVAWIAA